ncbi:hypothetical protein Tco_1332791 [Tanacetum coccineum]
MGTPTLVCMWSCPNLVLQLVGPLGVSIKVSSHPVFLPLKGCNRGSWSDSDEEEDEKAKDETCLMAQASSEVHFESSYFSDENSSIDDIILDTKEGKVAKTLDRNKEVDLESTTCQTLKLDNEKLKEEAFKLTQFKKSTHSLNEMLSLQKPSGDKSGLGFNSFEASTSGTKKTEFVKSQNEAPSGSGP